MNENGPYKLTGSGTIRRRGFVGVGVAFRRECVTVGMGCEVPRLGIDVTVHFLLTKM